uniref:Uncharacterized protein n=1 Tax=Rousettus aegyptiacus TaxID=9407 RepID=A0A7J8E8C5_ROUAE|nr:hypothetical protein HJG63_008244 [Rousettus aegyptiacus]
MFGGTGLRATSRREVAAGFADSWPRALASSSRRSLPALGAQGAGEGRRAAAEASGATRQHLLDLIIVIIAIAITRCCHVFSHGGSNGTSGRDLRLPRPAPPTTPSPAHDTPAPPPGGGAWSLARCQPARDVTRHRGLRLMKCARSHGKAGPQAPPFAWLGKVATTSRKVLFLSRFYPEVRETPLEEAYPRETKVAFLH